MFETEDEEVAFYVVSLSPDVELVDEAVRAAEAVRRDGGNLGDPEHFDFELGSRVLSRVRERLSILDD